MSDARLFTKSEPDSNVQVPEDFDRYLTFMSDNLIFGVSTEYVIEIITNYTVRAVPMVPNYVTGVINLRGQVLPVIDIRLKMNKPSIEMSSLSCIIILQIDSTLVGILVDSVLQVQEIDAEQASSIPIDNHQELANGMIKLEDGSVVLLLDCSSIIDNV